jgi:hypothetical protein
MKLEVVVSETAPTGFGTLGSPDILAEFRLASAAKGGENAILGRFE